jgi:hypothetical protein
MTAHVSGVANECLRGALARGDPESQTWRSDGGSSAEASGPLDRAGGHLDAGQDRRDHGQGGLDFVHERGEAKPCVMIRLSSR